MTTSEVVRAEARLFLPWLIAAPLVACASWMLDGIFIGATRTRDMRNMMAISFAGYALIVSLLAPVWGNHGLWAALVALFRAARAHARAAVSCAREGGAVIADYSYE